MPSHGRPVMSHPRTPPQLCLLSAQTILRRLTPPISDPLNILRMETIACNGSRVCVAATMLSRVANAGARGALRARLPAASAGGRARVPPVIQPAFQSFHAGKRLVSTQRMNSLLISLTLFCGRYDIVWCL